MPKFLYTATTADQHVKSGELEAADLPAARVELESQGLIVVSITQQLDESPATTAPSFTADATSNQHDIVEHSDSLLLKDRIANFLESREVLVPALLALLEELPAGSKRRRLAEVVTDIESGVGPDQLAAADDAADIWLPLIGGSSPFESNRFLCDLFEETARTNAARARAWRVFAYPLVIFLMAIAVVVFLGIVVVPSFQDIYEDFGLALPALTELVLKMSRAIRFHPILVCCTLVGLMGLAYGGLLLVRYLQSSSWEFSALSNGNSRQVTTMAEFVRRLVEGLKTNLPLSTSLRMAGQSCDTTWLRRETEALALSLEQTGKLAAPRNSGFPPTVVYALSAGHDGGPSIRLLEELVENYTERVDTRFNWASGFLPIMGILVVGMAVALVVLALYVPLIQLINGLTG